MNQTLINNEIPATDIIQLSGHKNLQSVTNYSMFSKIQLACVKKGGVGWGGAGGVRKKRRREEKRRGDWGEKIKTDENWNLVPGIRNPHHLGFPHMG